MSVGYCNLRMCRCVLAGTCKSVKQCEYTAHKPDPTSKGHVGSSVLLVAPSGEQQLDPTGSQLAVGLPVDSSKDKGGDPESCCADCGFCEDEGICHDGEIEI